MMRLPVKKSTTSSTTEKISNSQDSNLIFPTPIFDRSKMLLITERRISLERLMIWMYSRFTCDVSESKRISTIPQIPFKGVLVSVNELD